MPKKAKAVKSRGKAAPAPAAIPSKPKAAKPKAAKPKVVKVKRNYEKLRTRKTGNQSNPFVVHNAAVNLAHARWAVTPKQYNTIQSLKRPKPKPTVKPKPKPLTRSSTKTKTNTKTGVQPVTDLFDNSYRIPKKRRSTRGKK